MPQTSVLLGAVPLTIPFSLALVSNDVYSFDAALGTFFAPFAGAYRFDFTVTLGDTGTGARGSVSVLLQVDGVSQSSLICTFPGGVVDLQTVSGSSVLRLQPGQAVTLAALRNDGAATSSAIGPVAVAAPPYPTLFSGQSLF